MELGSSKTRFSNQEMQRWKVKRSPEDKDSWSPPGDGEIIEFGLCDCGPSRVFLLFALVFFLVFFFVFYFAVPKKQWRIL